MRHVGHLIKIVFANGVAGALGWFALMGLGVLKISQKVEGFTASPSDQNAQGLWAAMEALLLNLNSGVIIFLATAVACVPLSEIVRSRSFLYYLGATGAAAGALAAALIPSFALDPAWQGSTPTVLFAVAGLFAGSIYWLIAGRTA